MIFDKISQISILLSLLRVASIGLAMLQPQFPAGPLHQWSSHIISFQSRIATVELSYKK